LKGPNALYLNTKRHEFLTTSVCCYTTSKHFQFFLSCSPDLELLMQRSALRDQFYDIKPVKTI